MLTDIRNWSRFRVVSTENALRDGKSAALLPSRKDV